ncbi:MAG: DUF1501 domain-containing protein, partial [Planctomycetaceae bacterium]|nr:DUF1501 domain-containing protein [Planctomycetaceae bacterium]
IAERKLTINTTINKPKDRPVQVPDLHATLCHALGIDPEKEVMTPLQRPMKLVDGGSPVMELFG